MARRTFIRLHVLLLLLLVAVMALAVVTDPAAHAAPASTRPAPVHVNQNWKMLRNDDLRVRLSDMKYNIILAPCQFEDSVNCWWNAPGRGNHAGHSFVAVLRDGWTCLAYLRLRDRHMDRCIEGDVATARLITIVL